MSYQRKTRLRKGSLAMDSFIPAQANDKLIKLVTDDDAKQIDVEFPLLTADLAGKASSITSLGSRMGNAEGAITALQGDTEDLESVCGVSDGDESMGSFTAGSNSKFSLANDQSIKQLLQAIANKIDSETHDQDVAEALLATVNGDSTTNGSFRKAIADLVDSAPGALDTLNELAAAMGDDENFATTVTNLIAAERVQRNYVKVYVDNEETARKADDALVLGAANSIRANHGAKITSLCKGEHLVEEFPGHADFVANDNDAPTAWVYSISTVGGVQQKGLMLFLDGQLLERRRGDGDTVYGEVAYLDSDGNHVDAGEAVSKISIPFDPDSGSSFELKARKYTGYGDVTLIAAQSINVTDAVLSENYVTPSG